jgi:hypothetical protein
MRIDGVSIHNFRGIRRAEISGVGDEAVVTISGRNGSGKSLVLEAMGLLWRADRLPSGLQLPFLLGSWGDQLSIEMEITLTPEERRALEDATSWLGGATPPAPQRAGMRLDLSRTAAGGVSIDPWLHLLRHPDFWRTHQFGQLDHLPADRSTSRGEQAQVNPALLHEEQREQLRTQIVGSYAQQRQVVGISGIAPLLATAD